MRLRVDREANALVVTPDGEEQPGHSVATDGTIDVGAGGVLLGVEVRGSEGLSGLAKRFAGWGGAASVEGDSAYVALMAGDDDHVRSAEIVIGVGVDDRGLVSSLTIPRRGVGYEITYPSGNR